MRSSARAASSNSPQRKLGSGLLSSAAISTVNTWLTSAGFAAARADSQSGKPLISRVAYVAALSASSELSFSAHPDRDLASSVISGDAHAIESADLVARIRRPTALGRRPPCAPVGAHTLYHCRRQI